MKVKDYIGECGICNRCGEWTEVLQPCCGVSVSFEGGSIDLSDFDEVELDEYLESV